MTDAEQTITTDHVHALLDADDSGTILGLVGGRVEVLDAAQRDSDEYRGALEVITRDELIDRLGDDPSDDQLAEQADVLTEALRLLGG
jgi:NADH dehydrogenase